MRLVVGTVRGPLYIKSMDRTALERLGLRNTHSMARISRFSSNSHGRVAEPDGRCDETCTTAKRATRARTMRMKRMRMKKQEDEGSLPRFKASWKSE